MTTRCRSCGAPIIWMVTEQGKKIPVDPDDVDEIDLEYEEGTPIFDPSTHISHFATCPDANKWRR